MLWGMSNVIGTEDFPTELLEGAPFELRAALRARGKAIVAERVYRRRGWNTSAIRAEIARRSSQINALLDQWEDRETNPTLF